jgi:inosine-uridine nucleoside N-ribohydrolase
MKRLPLPLLVALVLAGLVPNASGQPAAHPPITDRSNPTAENPRRIILDIDPGIDDAMAVLLATQSPELQIEAITVVSGNVIVDLGAENALKLVELAGRPDIVVAKGAKYPLVRKLVTAELIHGKNGLGDVELPRPTKKLDPRHAVDVIIEIVNANPGAITLVPVGPLTNIALAFREDPTLPSKIPEIILMGGSIAGGNASPAAEANIHNDPEAAKVVFNSGIPITMVGLGATRQAKLYRRHLPMLANSGSPLGKFVAEASDFYLRFSEMRDGVGADLHDPLAVGMAFDKTFAKELRPMHIDVETKGELTYGETVANRDLELESYEDVGDHNEITSFPKVEPNAEIPLVVDGDRFVEIFVERLSQQPRKP